MDNTAELISGQRYCFTIRPWTSPDGSKAAGELKARRYLRNVDVDGIAFYEVERLDNGKLHLIEVESVSNIDALNEAQHVERRRTRHRGCPRLLAVTPRNQRIHEEKPR